MKERAAKFGKDRIREFTPRIMDKVDYAQLVCRGEEHGGATTMIDLWSDLNCNHRCMRVACVWDLHSLILVTRGTNDD